MNNPNTESMFESSGTQNRAEGEMEVHFRFLRGITRLAVINSSKIVIFLTILLFVSAELPSSNVGGVSDLILASNIGIASINLSTISSLILLLLWGLVLFITVLKSGVINTLEAVKNGGGLPVVSILVLGTITSLLLVYPFGKSPPADSNIIFVSGYLLMILILGNYLRTSMVYTEELINTIDDKVHPSNYGHTTLDEFSNNDSDDLASMHTYSTFVEDIDQAMRDKIWIFPTSHVFGLVLILPFAFIWLENGPQNLGGPATTFVELWNSPAPTLTYIVNMSIDFVIAVIAYRFIILTKYISDLSKGVYEVSENNHLTLKYIVQHPDDCAGLRELGDFAMRVNMLLIGALVYLVYRVYAQGWRVLRNDAEVASISADMLMNVPINWLMGYIGPVFLFTIIAGVWLYHSFWGLHKKMSNDRTILINHWPDISAEETAHIEIEETDWEDIRDAPVWPIDSRQIIPLILANLAPAFIMALQLLT